MNNQETNNPQNGATDPLERVAAFKPEHQAMVPEHVVEQSFARKPQSRFMAALTAKRVGWTALAAGVVAAIGATAVMPAALTASHSGYLFSANGGSMSGALKASGDSKFAMGVAMPSFQVQYTAGPNLSTDGGTGHVYQLTALGNPETIIKQLAGALHVTGKIEHTPADKANYSPETYSIGAGNASIGITPSGTAVGSADESQPSLTVYAYDSGNQVYYYDPSASQWVNCNMGLIEVDGKPVPPCAVDDQPMPSASEAFATTEKLLSALGIQAATKLASLQDGDYLLTHSYINNGAYSPAKGQDLQVTAALVVDGKPTAETIMFNWTEGYSAIASISGSLAKAVDKGAFDTLSEAAVVSRLSGDNSYAYRGESYVQLGDVKWSNVTYSGFRNRDSAELKSIFACASFPDNWVSPDDTVSPGGSGSATAVPEPSASSEPAVSPTVFPVATPTDVPTASPTDTSRPDCNIPTDPKTGLALLQSTITRADSSLLAIYGANDTQWLVPGYDLYDETGYVASVFSVVDGVIDISQPAVMPMTR